MISHSCSAQDRLLNVEVLEATFSSHSLVDYGMNVLLFLSFSQLVLCTATPSFPLSLSVADPDLLQVWTSINAPLNRSLSTCPLDLIKKAVDLAQLSLSDVIMDFVADEQFGDVAGRDGFARPAATVQGVIDPGYFRGDDIRVDQDWLCDFNYLRE